MFKILAPALCALALAGCAAPDGVATPTSTASSAIPTAPQGGVLLASLGFRYGPAGFSIPSNVHITDRVDSRNNVTLVLTSPNGAEMVAYLREHLPQMGFEVTADTNNSMLFHNDEYSGAYTASGEVTALTLRTDQETQ